MLIEVEDFPASHVWWHRKSMSWGTWLILDQNGVPQFMDCSLIPDFQIQGIINQERIINQHLSVISTIIHYSPLLSTIIHYFDGETPHKMMNESSTGGSPPQPTAMQRHNPTLRVAGAKRHGNSHGKAMGGSVHMCGSLMESKLGLQAHLRYVYIYVCIYLFIYLFIYIYMYICIQPK